MAITLKLKHKALLIVSGILFFELGFLVTLGHLIETTRKEALNEQKTKLIAGKLLGIFEGVAEVMRIIATRERGIDEALKELRSTSARLHEQIRDLSHRVKDHPEYRERVERILKIVLIGTKAAERVGEMMRDGNAGGALAFSEAFKKHNYEVKLWDEVGLLLDEHDERLASGAKVQRRNRQLQEWWLVAGVVLNLGFAIIIYKYYMDTIRKIHVLTENSGRLAIGADLLPPVKGSDEIRLLDTSFRQMAATLTEAARKERAIVENTSDVMTELTREFAFARVSPACNHLWGYKPEELEGKNIVDLVIPEQREFARTSLGALLSGEPNEFEVEMKRQDGSTCHMLCSGRWSADDSSLYLVCHDITARVVARELLTASEKRVRTMIDNMLVGLITTKLDGTIEMINSRTSEILVYQTDDLAGRSILTLFPNARTTDANEFLLQVRKSDSNKPKEFDALKKNGSTVPVEVSSTGFSTVDGERLLINLVDITERKQIERMKEEFVAMISHDLKTPLNSVYGFVELVEDGIYGELTARGTERVELAARNISRLLRLISDLLEITKLESGQMELKYEQVTTAAMVKRCLESVKDFADKHKVELEQTGNDISVSLDGHRIERVIVNLLSNSVKFSPEGSTVTVDVSEAPDNMVHFKVIDRGRGVPESHRQLIFERYKQVKASDSTKKGGTGLGLAICKSIVEQHGGSIGIESEEGKGSTFWFRLPHEAPKA